MYPYHIQIEILEYIQRARSNHLIKELKDWHGRHTVYLFKLLIHEIIRIQTCKEPSLGQKVRLKDQVVHINN